MNFDNLSSADIPFKHWEISNCLDNKTLNEINCSKKDSIMVFNKIDQYKHTPKETDDLTPIKKENLSLNHWKKTWMAKENIDAVFISCLKKTNTQNLKSLVYEKIKNILNKINHKRTEICAIAERSFLKTLGGDCDTALGCYAELKNKKIKLKAQLFSDNGFKVFNLSKTGNVKNPFLLGKKLGNEMLKKAGNNFKKKR